jgi:hypothetical protein
VAPSHLGGAPSQKHLELAAKLSTSGAASLLTAIQRARRNELTVGHLPFLGAYVQLWSPIPPGTLGREPSLGEMALILQAAARGEA